MCFSEDEKEFVYSVNIPIPGEVYWNFSSKTNKELICVMERKRYAVRYVKRSYEKVSYFFSIDAWAFHLRRGYLRYYGEHDQI